MSGFTVEENDPPLNLPSPIKALVSASCSGLSAAEHRVVTQEDLLSSLASALRVNADESWQTLEETDGCASYLVSTASGKQTLLLSVCLQRPSPGRGLTR